MYYSVVLHSHVPRISQHRASQLHYTNFCIQGERNNGKPLDVMCAFTVRCNDFYSMCLGDKSV